MKPIHLRMERASEHAADLKAEVASFFETEPYEIVHEFDPNAAPEEFPPGVKAKGIHRYRVVVRKEVPDRISILAGDILKDLRSALDYVAWQLALTQSDTPPPTTAFPIFGSEKFYLRDKARYIGGIDPAIHPIFDSVQPYHAGDKATEQPLWVLHRMANDDKHKMPHVVGSLPQGVLVQQPPGVGVFMGAQIGPFEDGDQVAFVGIERGADPETELKVQVSFAVAFGKDTPARSVESLFGEIDGIGGEVDAVIAKFEPFIPA